MRTKQADFGVTSQALKLRSGGGSVSFEKGFVLSETESSRVGSPFCSLIPPYTFGVLVVLH